MNHKLSYTCEDDKCYGVTGMAIGIMVYESDEMLSAISLDAAPGDMVELADDFYFQGSQGMSAKNAWNHLLRSYNLSAAMTIANVMCRFMVRNRKQVDSEIKKMLLDILVKEGSDECSLEEDESRRLFEKNYNYLYRVFNHQGVHDLAHSFAERLKHERRLSHSDIIEQLHGLHVI